MFNKRLETGFTCFKSSNYSQLFRRQLDDLIKEYGDSSLYADATYMKISSVIRNLF